MKVFHYRESVSTSGGVTAEVTDYRVVLVDEQPLEVLMGTLESTMNRPHPNSGGVELGYKHRLKLAKLCGSRVDPDLAEMLSLSAAQMGLRDFNPRVDPLYQEWYKEALLVEWLYAVRWHGHTEPLVVGDHTWSLTALDECATRSVTPLVSGW